LLWLLTFVFGLCCLFISLLAFAICSFSLFTSTICFYRLLHLFLLLVLVDCFSCSLQLFVSTRFGLLLLLLVAKQWCNKLSLTPFLFCFVQVWEELQASISSSTFVKFFSISNFFKVCSFLVVFFFFFFFFLNVCFLYVNYVKLFVICKVYFSYVLSIFFTHDCS
jgi:hypothetical protein